MKEYKEFPFDINLLEHPLYFVDEKQNKEGVFVHKNNGYTITSFKKPTKIDILILYFLLLKSKNQKWNKKVYVSSYEVIKNCKLSVGRNSYERIKQSLKVWVSTYISFEKCFYTHDKNKISLDLNILQHVEHTKDNKLEIVFTDKFLAMIEESTFFQTMDFDKILQIKNPSAMRLYDILVKNFYKRTEWKISIHKLAEKIPLQEKYKSHIIKKIVSSLKIISQKTGLNISVEIETTGLNDGVFIFRKIEKSMLEYMVENQEIDGPSKKQIFNEDILKQYAPEEIENFKINYIENELSKNKFLLKTYNSKGFNETIKMSFVSWLKTKKERV